MLWDLNDGKHLYTLDSGDTIESLCFSPNRYWLCAATGPIIKIWVCLILKNIGECICLVVNQPFLTMFAHFKIVSIIPVTSDILNTLYHFGCCHLLLLVSFCKRKGCPGSVATWEPHGFLGINLTMWTHLRLISVLPWVVTVKTVIQQIFECTLICKEVSSFLYSIYWPEVDLMRLISYGHRVMSSSFPFLSSFVICQYSYTPWLLSWTGALGSYETKSVLSSRFGIIGSFLSWYLSGVISRAKDNIDFERRLRLLCHPHTP